MTSAPTNPTNYPVTWFDWLKFTSPFVIGLIAFVWYRRGRLWKFYYTLLDATVEQMVHESINREAWQEIARLHTTSLGTDYFGALFHFEIEYLRFKIHESMLKFRSADGLYTSYLEFDKELNTVRVEEGQTVTDKAHFANTLMRKIFFKEVRLGGIGLFFKSVRHMVIFKTPKGVENKVSKTPIRGTLQTNIGSSEIQNTNDHT
jgi:hypothetical protein